MHAHLFFSIFHDPSHLTMQTKTQQKDDVERSSCLISLFGHEKRYGHVASSSLSNHPLYLYIPSCIKPLKQRLHRLRI